ncbi:MAG: hypothetical protein HETSPECPRED_000710 [Heterodermia speciosa]|uniref:Terpene synthase n=1 Tax=Heterodermia speciosa TaxID=116794 RepID=A0A8H3G7H0_9LECA|nr:MAG: hypothetical protein HETSPECPRED_000710 [Heterodermia speciosa]
MASTPREALIKSFKGQKIRIYDLDKVMSGWPSVANPNLDILRHDVQARTTKLFTGKRREIAEAVNPAWFGSLWWPYAGIEELRIATYLGMWLFSWDDETDSSAIASLNKDYSSGQSFRRRTWLYVQSSLGFEISAADQQVVDQEHDVLITSFGTAGEAIRNSCSLEKRQLLLDEVKYFLNCQAEEQSATLRVDLPTVEQYRSNRMGTSGVGVLLAITEYCCRTNLPLEVTQSGAMKWLWDETNSAIWMANDILSIKKELDNDQVDTLVPLLAHRYQDAQVAVDIAISMLKNALENFEKAAALLLAEEPRAREDIIKFIDACRFACTANFKWSFNCRRYGLKAEDVVDGVLELTL